MIGLYKEGKLGRVAHGLEKFREESRVYQPRTSRD